MQPLVLVFLFFLWAPLFSTPAPALQHSQTASLCPHLPPDGSVDLTGTVPTRVLEGVSDFPPSSGGLWLSLSALCSWKAATGSRNLPSFCSPFEFQKLVHQPTAKKSALGDSEICRTPTFPQRLPCFLKFCVLFLFFVTFIHEHCLCGNRLNKTFPELSGTLYLSQNEKASLTWSVFQTSLGTPALKE